MRFIISMFYNLTMSSLLGGLSVAVMGVWGIVFALIFNLLFVWPTATRIWADDSVKFLSKF